MMPCEEPDRIHPTIRLYWEDDHCFDAEARILGVDGNAIAFDRTCFYPGGGGQPSDSGTATLHNGQALEIASARADVDQVVWHVVNGPMPGSIAGQSATLSVDRRRRVTLARHHTVLHVLNSPYRSARTKYDRAAGLLGLDHRRANWRGLFEDRL